MDIWEMIASERLRLARDLGTLEGRDWALPTVCEQWDVKTVAAHTVLPFNMSKPKFMLTMVKNRGDAAKTVDELSTKLAFAVSTAEIISSLRENADSKWTPPKAGPEVPLSEIVVHGQDIRGAVGIASGVPDAIAEMLLREIDPTLRQDYAHRISAAGSRVA